MPTAYLHSAAIRDAETLAKADGLRYLFHIVTDGPPSLIDAVIPAIAHLLDSPSSRSYIHPYIDVEVRRIG